jgi:undecaprenyl-diphosphatase
VDLFQTIEKLNQDWFLILNANSHTPAWLIQVAVFVACWWVVAIPILLFLLWRRSLERRREEILLVCGSLVFSMVISSIIRSIWVHPRPFMDGIGHAWIYHVSNGSIPSNHATVFFTLGFSLLAIGRRSMGALALLAGVLVGAARVFLGVHYPLDIIGACVVSGVACVVVLVSMRYVFRYHAFKASRQH